MPTTAALIAYLFLFLLILPYPSLAQSEAGDHSGPQASEQQLTAETTSSSATPSVEMDSGSHREHAQEHASSPIEEPNRDLEETPQQREQFGRALIHIKKAEALFGSDNFEAALAEYQQAYIILRGHPKQFLALHNIGLCHERLFRYKPALQYYNDYLEKGAELVLNRAEVEGVIQTLTHLLSTLRISVNTKADVWVDEVLIGHAPGDFLVAAGRHTVELRSKGYESAKLEVSLPAQKTREIRFSLKTIEPGEKSKEGIHPGYFWTSSMLSVVALGLGTYFGINYISKNEEAEKHKNEDIRELIKDIETSETRANVAFAFGGALGLTSLVLFFLTDWNNLETSPSNSEASQQLRLTVEIGTRCAFLGLDTDF